MARMAIGAEEKKKLFVLGGLLAAIMVVVVVLYVPKGGSTSDDTGGATPAGKDEKTPPKTEGAPPAAGAAGAPGAAASGEAGGTGGTGAGNISAASLVSVSNFRNDPFEPVPLPPPLPTPPPPPPPPGPVNIQPPRVVLSGPGDSDVNLPPFSPNGSSSTFGRSSATILRDLPPVQIRRAQLTSNAPRVIVPPGGQGSSSAGRSPGKRLSGVIIGDSVRAILEISDGETTVSRNVQPGDEVDGIRILRIERITEGGRPVTRMFIRENGEERFVDLRPAPQQTGEGGAAGGGRGGLRQ